jgi:hypothetical protein
MGVQDSLGQKRIKIPNIQTYQTFLKDSVMGIFANSIKFLSTPKSLNFFLFFFSPKKMEGIFENFDKI